MLLPHNPGDVVMGLYALSAVRKKFPKAQIDYIVSEECRDLVSGHPYLNEVFVVPSSRIKNLWHSESLTEIQDVVKGFVDELTRVEYDLILNFFQDNYGAVLSGFLKCRQHTGYLFNQFSNYQVNNRYMEHLFSIPVARHQNPWHVVDIFLRSFGGQSRIYPLPVLPPMNKKPEYFNDVPGKPLVFQLGTAWEGKKWPLEYWQTLYESVSKEGLFVTFIGSSEEAHLFEKFCSGLSNSAKAHLEKNSLNLMGKTTLLELFAMINKSEWLITGDTVSMHLAASTDCRVIALFGSSNPVETGPYGRHNFIFQFETDIPETLPFKDPSENMIKIKPGMISDFMFKGLLPQGIHVWETTWDPELKCQILVNANLEPHPFQKNPLAMEKALNPDNEIQDISRASDSVINLMHQIDKCLLEGSKENISRLSELDKSLEVETHRDIFWEACRVHSNGLPLVDFNNYLKHRKNRLVQCMQEQKLFIEFS